MFYYLFLDAGNDPNVMTLKSPCETKGGYGPCVFPFKYQGTEYNACSNAGGYEHWCAYEVDEVGVNDVMTKWAYCMDNCVYPGTRQTK